MKSLKNIPKIQWQDEVDLSRYTTFGIGGKALVATAQTEEALAELLRRLWEKGLPSFILGGGSNVLFSDSPFEGVVIRMQAFRKFEVRENRVLAGAGVGTPWALKQAGALGLAGLEPLAGVPGTLGGAIFMNAGGKYGSLDQRISRVKWMDWEGEAHWWDRGEIPFTYRRSNIPGLVLEGELELVPSTAEAVQNRCKVILLEKKASQPLGERSAGCAFKNPSGHSAGRLIDQCGLKGFSLGGAVVSLIHGNFILNRRSATARDVCDLVELIQDRVYQKFGVQLEPEIKIVQKEIQWKRVA